ncbi:MAG TPA: copper-translocating P-type ATPase, partial [Candidatus Limnocylindrales bacterium]|nr:copper-translocating P-type ATPase [Candidatus Limnocylindrales bacterium]
ATDMDVLIATGTTAAYGYSLGSILAPDFFRSAGAAGPDGSLPLYFDTAAVIIVLLLLGRYLELRARLRASQAVRLLVSRTPRTARLVVGATERDVEVGSIRAGDIVRVRPGESVPVDGVVVAGASTIDESMLTGESLPVAKGLDDLLIGGTLNGGGTLTFRATRVGADTVLARIVRLVSEAQGSRAPIQRLADAVTGWFVPAVLGLGALTFVGWLLLGPAPALNHAILNSVAVLIIACPCALGLAPPVSLMVGTGRAAEAGVLFRSAEALERLGSIRTVAIDKTGTLTEGRPRVTDVVRNDDAPPEAELLALVAAAERGSEHPLGAAIVREAVETRGLDLPAAEAFVAEAGGGVEAMVEGRTITVGRSGFVGIAQRDDLPPSDDLRPSDDRLVAEAVRLAGEGKTAVFVAIDGRPVAVIGIADTLKRGSREAMAALRRLGLEVVMLTGDSTRTAQAIASQAEIERVLADVRPDGKAGAIRRLAESGPVAMVGDGINDAPALAAADVGLAMGGGTDVAIESAGVTLLSGDLRTLVTAIELSRATMRNIRQNLFWAFAYNVILIPVAMGVLFPFTGLLLDPVLAAVAMALSSVTVVSNALRLRGFRTATPRGNATPPARLATS